MVRSLGYRNKRSLVKFTSGREYVWYAGCQTSLDLAMNEYPSELRVTMPDGHNVGHITF